MNAREIEQIFTLVLAGWPAQRSKLSEQDVQAMAMFYADGLSDLDFAATKHALLRLGRTAKFIPNVADIREAVGVVHHGEQSPAIIAWGEIHKLLSTKGAYRTPGVDFEITDPVAREVCRSIGWEAMCTGLPDHIRSRFLDGYGASAKLVRKEVAAADGARSTALPIRATGERLGRGATLKQLMSALEPCEAPCGDAACGKSGAYCKRGPAR
jgi:hypothetical protein